MQAPSGSKRGVLPGGVGQTPYQILRDAVTERAVRILLECILVMQRNLLVVSGRSL